MSPFLLLFKKTLLCCFEPIFCEERGAQWVFKEHLVFCFYVINEDTGHDQGTQRKLLKSSRRKKMGLLSVDLLITLQILPVFFSNCLFLALYDSVVLLKHMVLLLSRSKSARGEWRRMLTSEGLRCVWNSFLLDAYKQVG